MAAEAELPLFPKQFQEFAMPDMQPLLPTKAGASVHSPFQVSKIKVSNLGARRGTELTLPLALPRYHVSPDTEVQPLQQGLQAQVHALPQPVVHGQGPQQDEEHCSEQE